MGSRRDQGNGVRMGRQRRGALGCPAAPFPVLLHCSGGRGGGGVGKGGVRLSLGRAGLGEAVLVWVCCCSPAPFLNWQQIGVLVYPSGRFCCSYRSSSNPAKKFSKAAVPMEVQGSAPIALCADCVWCQAGAEQLSDKEWDYSRLFFLFWWRNVKRRENQFWNR